MSNKKPDDVSQWWRTSIIDMVPGKIHLCGHPVETLIGNVSFVDTMWLLTRGDLPSAKQSALLEAALVAAVDHGPQAPSIAAARMAVSCGLDINNAMGSAVNMLGDVHGGAGEQASQLYQTINQSMQPSSDLDTVVSEQITLWQKEQTRFIPGFGHRFHKPVDPRAPRLLSLVDNAAEDETVSGNYAMIARQVEIELRERVGKPVPMNIDGATAVIFAELGFAPPLARGFFCLSRSVGILAHAWEQYNEGTRNKGPTPPEYRWVYDGKNPIHPE